MELAPLTTLQLGGPAARGVEARTEEALVAAVREADAGGEPALVLGGGSNVVVADDGFPGTVVRVLTTGVAREERGDRVVLEVQAGEDWDALVARTVAEGLAGMECLSGIPGSVGATPIQNVGAYGQEVAETIVAVRALDRTTGELETLDAAACAFAYRSSTFKREPGRWVVLAVTFALEPGGRSAPLRYAELARTLGASVGARVPVADVREAVLGLRRAKGMVVDPADPDSVSAGSFFTNPVLTHEQLERLEARVAERMGPDARLPRFPQADGTVKTSAAWLIERAGFVKGHGAPGPVAISGKHTLALTNRGGGTAQQLVGLAREIVAGVERAWGVSLVPEPVFVGHAWEPPAPPAPAPARAR